MDDRELKLECLKLALPLVSPSVDKRVDSVVETATLLYNYLNLPEAPKPGLTVVAEKQWQRKPRPRDATK